MKGGDDDLPECSICFDTILPSQAIFSCANEHIFHINCARNYCLFRQMRNLGYTFECPLCRDITRTCPPAQNPNGTFTTYGDWLDDHSTDDSVYDYGEDGYDDITRGRLNTMIINETFSRRRLHIHNYRLHLFDGETHRYLGTTYYHSPSIIINYIYENVYTPIYENN